MTAGEDERARSGGGGSGMWKYYVMLFGAVALVLAYTYVADPCNRLLKADFARMHPGWWLLSSEAERGSPESVRCRISYRKPESPVVHEEVWVYHFRDTAWEFSRVAEPEHAVVTSRE